jgi:hypothetical protein
VEVGTGKLGVLSESAAKKAVPFTPQKASPWDDFASFQQPTDCDFEREEACRIKLAKRQARLDWAIQRTAQIMRDPLDIGSMTEGPPVPRGRPGLPVPRGAPSLPAPRAPTPLPAPRLPPGSTPGSIVGPATAGAAAGGIAAIIAAKGCIPVCEPEKDKRQQDKAKKPRKSCKKVMEEWIEEQRKQQQQQQQEKPNEPTETVPAPGQAGDGNDQNTAPQWLERAGPGSRRSGRWL